jgi:hypothetical protein
MDTFYIKLIFFWAIVWFIRFLARQFPNSLFTGILYSWHGPTPKDNEAQSHYLFSWAIYSLKWFLFFVMTLFLVMTTADRFFHDQYKDNFYFQMLFMFGIPLISLMAFVGGLGCLVKGLYLKLLKKDLCFDATVNDFTFKN